MARKRFAAEQIIIKLREAEVGSFLGAGQPHRSQNQAILRASHKCGNAHLASAITSWIRSAIPINNRMLTLIFC